MQRYIGKQFLPLESEKTHSYKGSSKKFKDNVDHENPAEIAKCFCSVTNILFLIFLCPLDGGVSVSNLNHNTNSQVCGPKLSPPFISFIDSFEHISVKKNDNKLIRQSQSNTAF